MIGKEAGYRLRRVVLLATCWSAALPSSLAGAEDLPAAVGGKKVAAFVAEVDGKLIERRELAAACLRYAGEEVLEELVSRQLVREHCRRVGVTVTQQEVEAEMRKTAERHQVELSDLLSAWESERGIDRELFADRVWQLLALRKLVGPQLNFTQADLQKAFEAEYGEAVQARMIAVRDPELAVQILQQAKAAPDDFARLAREHSEDVNSASSGGLVQPIRRYRGEPEFEEAAFALQPGEISDVIHVAEYYFIIQCEQRLPPRESQPGQPYRLADVRAQLEEQVMEDKLPEHTAELFQRLKNETKVIAVFGDDQRQAQSPGVAAIVGDSAIAMGELAEACIERHGVVVLESLINKKILQNQLASRRVKITQDDLRAEIMRAAAENGYVAADGRPDVPGWLAKIDEQPGVSAKLYIEDAVWPSVALRKLVADQVEVTPEDVQKGYEANYGPRARCRAIVMTDQRQAQRVWDLARKTPTAENFADLASKFSVESGGREQGGLVPPIQRHGGQPLLEEAAFDLDPPSDPLSGVIQVGAAYVILYCEGFTQPEGVEFAEVQQLLKSDLLEKKMMLAMAEEYDRIRAQAKVENFLANQVNLPAGALPAPAAALPTAPRR